MNVNNSGLLTKVWHFRANSYILNIFMCKDVIVNYIVNEMVWNESEMFQMLKNEWCETNVSYVNEKLEMCDDTQWEMNKQQTQIRITNFFKQ